MIERFHVKGFKCLRDVAVDLGRFTVLIGENDTGKSSLLEAIALVGARTTGDGPDVTSAPTVGGDGQVLFEAHLRAGAVAPIDTGAAKYSLTGRVDGADRGVLLEHEDLSADGGQIRASAHLRANPAEGYDVSFADGGYVAPPARLKPRPPKVVIRVLRDACASQMPARLAFAARRLGSIRMCRLDPSAAKAVTPIALSGSPWGRSMNGLGLPGALDYLLGVERDRFDHVEREIRRLFPFVAGIKLRPSDIPDPDAEQQRSIPGKELWFRTCEGNRDVPARDMSDGVMLVLAYLTLAYAPTQPSVLLIEEPENGVHPHKLREVVGFLRSLAAAEDGPQIVLTTHSPYLLDFVDPEDVRVFGRRASGDTVVAKLTSLPGVEERLRGGFSLGELWFNVRENELLGDRLR